MTEEELIRSIESKDLTCDRMELIHFIFLMVEEGKLDLIEVERHYNKYWTGDLNTP